MKHTVICLLGSSAFWGTSAVNPCLDPTNAYYSCELDALEEVNLRGCEITDEDLDDIASCLDDAGRENILALHLSQNYLTTLPEGIFENLTALTNLYLWENALATLPEGIFSNLTGLENLNLRRNALNILPDAIFRDLTTVTTLYLDENKLTTLPAGVFQDLSQLEMLFLYSNPLTTLPEGIFGNLTALETLRLDDNALTTLPGGIFEDLTELESLNLEDNALTTLPTGIFRNLTDLDNLYLEDNDLECLPVIPAELNIFEVDPYGDKCGCSTANITNVCGEEPCTPGEFGYNCGATTLAPAPAPTPGPTALAPTPGPTTLAPATPAPVPIPTSAPAPTPVPTMRTGVPTVTMPVPDAGSTDSPDTTPITAGVVSAAVGAVLIGLGLCLWRRRNKRKGTESSQPLPSTSRDLQHDLELEPQNGADSGTAVISDKGTGRVPGNRYVTDSAAEHSWTATMPTANMSTAEQAELRQFNRSVASAASSIDESAREGAREDTSSSMSGRRDSRGGIGLREAVMAAAQNLALHCHIPGVSEAAAVVSTLVTLASDSRDIKYGGDSNLRKCRSIVRVLERASKVAGKCGETTTAEQRDLIEEVHFAVEDLVELIMTYHSKNKVSKVLMSTSFKRRQDDLEAAVDRALGRLQFGLQVQVGDDISAVKEDVDAVKEGMMAESLAEAHRVRRARRQRKLDQIEIPEDQVRISDELLGQGGFGEVFLAEYNTRNAAAKVCHITHDLGRREVLEERSVRKSNPEREKSQRKAFLRELEAMIRLRSPHTVGIYGAITSRPDRLVLVMELLPGGDLRSLLRNSEQPLPEMKSRRIIRDICAGMKFLHGKETVHGDLKSANVLLDGAGRAKIGDFGTSRWSHHTYSTGLATHTKGVQNAQMSLAWSAPEVLDASGSTYASDVYSFGIVSWEVLSRELPWANLVHPREVYIRVVLKSLRPDIPTDTPADMASMIRACWAGEVDARPTFSTIMERIESKGWRE